MAPDNVTKNPYGGYNILSRQPQQNTFKFCNGIEISSEFDSGNLARCQLHENDMGQPDPTYFNCYLSGDGLPYTAVGHYKTWFYFSVKGVKSGQTLTFSIRNMGNQGKLYKLGLRPVYRVHPNAMKWKRTSGLCQWNYGNEGFNVTFTHTFTDFNTTRDTVYFAWTYPYSF